MAKLFDKLMNRVIKGKLIVEQGDELGDFVKVKTSSDISELSDEVLDSLKVGDVVQKVTGNMKHCYIVTYKEEHHGICLSYFDCSYLETISYDYAGGHWVFNSKDVCEVQEKITSNTDLIVKTISQSEPNYTFQFDLTAPQDFERVSQYTRIEVVNGELHIIALAKFHNTAETTKLFALGVQELSNIPDELAGKLYGDSGKNLLEDDAGIIRVAPIGMSSTGGVNVYGLRIYSSQKNKLLLYSSSGQNVNTNTDITISFEANLSLF